jgi:hypothetical protein
MSPKWTSIGTGFTSTKVWVQPKIPQSKTSQKLKYVLYLIHFSYWCIFLLASDTGLIQAGSIFSTGQNL